MSKGRLEAFSDGVIAILITIMVLELGTPEDSSLAALIPLIPTLLSYLLSFVILGIYWNNHHHMFQAVTAINGRVLWANLHLLFWLSLFPFTTAWAGENPATPWPVALYGVVLLMAAVAYTFLTRTLVSLHGQESVLGMAVGRDFKGKLSLTCYAAAIPLAFLTTSMAWVLYVTVAAIWFIPDRRIENVLAQ